MKWKTIYSGPCHCLQQSQLLLLWQWGVVELNRGSKSIRYANDFRTQTRLVGIASLYMLFAYTRPISGMLQKIYLEYWAWWLSAIISMLLATTTVCLFVCAQSTDSCSNKTQSIWRSWSSCIDGQGWSDLRREALHSRITTASCQWASAYKGRKIRRYLL